MKEELKNFFMNTRINKTRFCADAGISTQHLNRIIAGTRAPTPYILNKIAIQMRRERVVHLGVLAIIEDAVICINAHVEKANPHRQHPGT